MNYKVTRRKVAEQFAIVNPLLLAFIDQSENSTKMRSNKIIEKNYSTPRFLTAPEVAIF